MLSKCKTSAKHAQTEEICHTKRIFSFNNEYIQYCPVAFSAPSLEGSNMMPEDMFRNHLWKFGKGLDGIIGMADLCNTSLTATAIRYTELTDDFLIVVISSNCKIDFCCFSQKAWRIKNKEIPKKGWPIPKNTATEMMFKEPLRIHKAERNSMQSDLSDWIECDISKKVTEEIKGLGKYGKVLTVLSL